MLVIHDEALAEELRALAAREGRAVRCSAGQGTGEFFGRVRALGDNGARMWFNRATAKRYGDSPCRAYASCSSASV